MPTVAELDVQINAKDDATATIAAIDALVKALDKDDVVIDIETDTDRALSEISELEAEISALSDETVTIEVDVDGEGEIEKLRAELALLRDKHIDVDVDVHDETVRQGTINLGKLDNQALNASRQVSFLAAAVLGLGTALIPIGAVGVAGVAALAAQLTVAGIGAALFGAVAVSAFGPVKDALTKMHSLQKQYNEAVTDDQRDAALAKMKALMESLTPAQAAMVREVERFRTAWGQLVSQFQPLVFQIATEGLRGIAAILPSLAPVIDGTGKAFLFLERAAVRALAGPFWQSFISMMGSNVNPLLREFGLTIGNLITGFAAMIMAFMPLTRDFSTGMLGMSKSFKEWAMGLRENQGFQDFVTYVRENTPIVLGLIGSFVLGLVALAKAGAPLGEALLIAATNLFEFLSALQRTHPMLLTVTLAVIGFTAVALNLIGPIVTIIRFVALLATGLGALGTAFSAVATVIGISGAALFTIVAIIALVVAGIIYAYTHFEAFRNIVDGVASALMAFGQAAYAAIVGALQTAVAWLSATFGPAVQAVITFVVEQFNKIRDWASENSATFAAAWDTIRAILSAVWNNILNEITTVLNVIQALWNAVWPTLAAVLSGVWTVMKGIISGALDIIMGIILVFAGILAGDWGAIWDGVVQILRGAWEMIKGIVQGGAQVLQALVDAFMAVLAAAWGLFWAGIVSAAQTAWSLLTTAASAAWAAIKAIFTAAQTGIQAGIDAFWAAVFAIFRAAWNLLVAGMRSFFTTLGSLVSAGWTALKAIFSAAQSAIQTGVNAFWTAVFAIFRAAWSGIQAGLSAFWSTLRSLTSSAMSAIGSVISSGWATIRSLVSSAMSAIRSAVSSGMSAVVSAVRSGISNAVSAVTGMAGAFFSAGASLMHSLASGIMSGIGAAVGAVKGAVGKLTDLLPGSPAKTGPLSGQGYALIRGQHLTEDLAAGIAGRSYLVDRAARDIADLMSLNTDPAGAYAAMTTPSTGGGGGGVTITVADGAVQVNVGSGVDPKAARDAFDGAAGDLADELLTAIRRREG